MITEQLLITNKTIIIYYIAVSDTMSGFRRRYQSGAQKRRARAEREERQRQEISSIKPMDYYFGKQLSPAATAPDGLSTRGHDLTSPSPLQDAGSLASPSSACSASRPSPCSPPQATPHSSVHCHISSSAPQQHTGASSASPQPRSPLRPASNLA
jgi:hypothetical protein